MPTISPTLIFVLMLLVTLAPAAVAWSLRRRQRRGLAALAASRGCDYRPGSDEDLARRLGPALPVIGAAAVRVTDVIEPPDSAGRRIVGRVDYSLGSVRHRRNNTRVFACDLRTDGTPGDIIIAPLDLARIAQFETLLDDLQSSRSLG